MLAPSAAAPAATATETVRRPEPGLARGAWESPPWALYAGGAIVVVLALVYLASRLGMVKLRRRKAP